MGSGGGGFRRAMVPTVLSWERVGSGSSGARERVKVGFDGCGGTGACGWSCGVW